MTPLAFAMILTGAGAVVQHPDSPPVIYVPYPPPPPIAVSVAPPSPSPAIPSFLDRRAPLTTRPSYPQRARADFNTYFSVDDYPLRERRRGAEAQVGFTVLVGPDGRVRSCTVTASSGSTRLDGATCRILESRARYSPAHDIMGVAINGQDSGIISWPVPPG